jgi:hypothetical protein
MSIPTNPDIKRELQNHLFTMSPRAFELFAGEFLVYVGMENISVSRYRGDGGIDAHGDLIAGTFRLPSGIQVKRYRNNVQRPDIEQFIGALMGRYSQGIFLTTAGFAPAANQRASLSIPRVLTLSGTEITAIMYKHQLGLKPSPNGGLSLDTAYFTDFEIQKDFLSRRLAESRETYNARLVTDEESVELNPEDDLISLRALSYALRIDTKTIRIWLEQGKLHADGYESSGSQSGYYFRRDRIESIRNEFNLKALPTSSEEWRQEFIDFNKTRIMRYSYKPVLVKALFKLVDRDGKVNMDDLVNEFRAFYIQRKQAGLPIELENADSMSNNTIRNLIVKNPLDRFRIQKFIEYYPDEGIVQIAPYLWQELRYHDILDVLESAEEQIHYYYNRQE